VKQENKEWKQFENDINKLLGLNKVVASGSKWHSKGDGASNNLIVDCKQTFKKSFSIKQEFLQRYENIALMENKNFAMPIRFSGVNGNNDYIVLPLDYFLKTHKKQC
jgi:hypothetical protein